MTIKQLRDRLDEILRDDPSLENHPCFIVFPNEVTRAELIDEEVGGERFAYVELIGISG